MRLLAALLIVALMTALGWHTQRTGIQHDFLASVPSAQSSPPPAPPPRPISKFYMAPADFPPDVRLDLVHPFENMPVFPEVNASYKAEGMRVPNIVHYTFFTPEDDVQREEPLHFLHYLGIRSSIEIHKPDVMILHYNALPHGEWWDEVAPYFTLNKVSLPKSIFGREIEHLAHKSDVVRLLALRHYGGIYMDLDMIAIRPFDELMYAPATMGFQLRPENQFANGCLLAEPKSRFMDLWWHSYEQFDRHSWDYNSGGKPMEIAKAYPEYVQALNGLAFFWPAWGDAERLLREDYYDFRATGQYGHHAWYRMAGAHELFDAMTPYDIVEKETSFYKLVRPFLGPRALDMYEKQKAAIGRST